jgi:hypothetical protein
MLPRMDAWLKETAAAATGVEPDLSDEEADALLEIARIAAHTSGDRRNAPLVCYLIGRGIGDRSLAEILETLKQRQSSS